MKVVFMGTPDFAVPSLEALIAEGHDVQAVVTQPDRPAGRGQKVKMSSVKTAALNHRLPVLQPIRVSEVDFIEKLRSINPDVIVVTAFGQKIPQEILSLPKYGCVNVHGSLLPKYRGASPINWAIIDGNTVTGITTMLMDAGWDTGDILLQAELPISSDDTAGTLHDKLAELGAKVLLDTLKGLEAGTVRPKPQDHSAATYVRMLKKEDAELDWDQPPKRVVDFVRGMQPWPVAYTFFGDRLVKIWKCKVLDNQQIPDEESLVPGTVFGSDDQCIFVAVRGGAVGILELQPENGRRMTGRDFLNGYHVSCGDRFSRLVGEANG